MELRITHETRYDYSPAVETAQHMAHLHPLDTPCQRLLAHRLDIAPTPAQRSQTPQNHPTGSGIRRGSYTRGVTIPPFSRCLS